MIKLSDIKKSINLLSENERKKFFKIAILVMIMALFDLFGVASILPFMSVVSNPDIINSNEYLSVIFERFEFESARNFLIALGGGSLFILVFGNLIKSFTTYVLLKFGYSQTHYLSRRLLEHYLQQPYEYFLNKHSSAITNIVVSEVKQVVHSLFVPLLNLFSRSFSALFLVIMLIAVNPSLAITVVVVLGGAYLSIFYYLKKSVEKLGIERTEINKNLFKVVSEIGGGVKLIKLMNKEEVYLDAFLKPSERLATVHARNAVYMELPRHIIEVIGFGGILLIVLFLVSSGAHADAISMAAFYAFAGYRLMPALQTIYTALNKVRFTLSLVDVITDELKDNKQITPLTETSDKNIQFNDKLLLKNIHFTYKGARDSSLSNINIEIRKNEFLGIIGPTGSGKSTLIDILLGLLEPTSGNLSIDNTKITKENIKSWQKQIGYVPQTIYLTDDTITKNIAFGTSEELIDIKKVHNAAKMAQIHDFIENQIKDGYETLVGEGGVRLSGGQRQRIGIARALYHDPELIVFDEATSALDDKTEQDLIEAVEQLFGKKTIVMIAHRLSTLKSADRILKLENGQITSG